MEDRVESPGGGKVKAISGLTNPFKDRERTHEFALQFGSSSRFQVFHAQKHASSLSKDYVSALSVGDGLHPISCYLHVDLGLLKLISETLKKN